MLKKLFSPYLLARTASNPHTHAGAFLLTLLALFVAAFHRFEGFAEPYQVWFRYDEIHYLGSWAPSFVEHLTGAFALCSLFTLFWSAVVKPTACNRALPAGVFAIVYFVLSTVMHDGLQYVATHDTDQLLQMLADVLGLGAALLWLAWPAAADDEPAFA